MEYKKVKVYKLKKSKFLRRRHSRYQIDCCIKSLERYGQYSPLVVSGDEVLCGHLVLDCLKRLDIRDAFVVDVGDISLEKKKEIRYIDNQTFDTGDWNVENLNKVLLTFDVSLLNDLGFDTADIDEFVNETASDDLINRILGDDKPVTIYECSNCGWEGDFN